MGKELEDWETAFGHVRRATIECEEQDEIEMFAALEAAFTKAWMDVRPNCFDSNAPIFAIGQPCQCNASIVKTRQAKVFLRRARK